MVFETFDMLIQESRDKIRSLWERRTIETMLGRLVHRRHDFSFRMKALKLVLAFFDAAYDVEADDPVRGRCGFFRTARTLPQQQGGLSHESDVVLTRACVCECAGFFPPTGHAASPPHKLAAPCC